MGPLIGALVGGASSLLSGMMGGGKPKSESSLTRQQRAVMQQVYEFLNGNLGKDLQQYPGQMVAPLLPGMVTAMNMAGSYDPKMFNDAESISRALSGKPSFDIDQASTDRYFNQSVVTPMMRTYDRVIAPRINEAYAAAGAGFSTRRGDKLSQVLGDIGTDLTGQRAQFARDDRNLSASLSESAMNRMMQAIPMAQQRRFEPLQASAAMSTALTPFQAWQQQQADSGYREWLRTRDYQSPYLSAALNFLGQSHTYTYQEPQNPWIKGGIQGLALAGSSGAFGSGIQKALGG